MTGMGGSGLSSGNSLITSAFATLELHQFLVALSMFLLASLVWMLLGPKFPPRAEVAQEPLGRTVLRMGFGFLWIFDAMLQTQAGMPLGLPGGVLNPAAATSPSWVRHLVANGASVWERQPIHMAVAVIWVQLGIGVWLLVAKRGLAGRLGALASLIWALSIWSAGTGFGGIFAPGSSLLLGTPGSSFFYAIASVLLLAPVAWWSRPRLTRRAVQVLGSFFVAMALLQAWPGRGTWAGDDRHHHAVGQLAAMAAAMSSVPQPQFFSSLVRGFGSAAGHDPVLINGAFVVMMAAIGIALLRGSRQSLKVALVIGVTFCLVTWVFVEDYGFFGGVGTDPNSMPPLVLLLISLVMAVTAAPRELPAPERGPMSEGLGGVVGVVFGAAAGLVVLLGALPMLAAASSASVEPLLAQALNTPPQQVNFTALPFSLIDQYGHHVTMGSFAGKTVALTFLDPLCVSDCPTIAREMAAADEILGQNQHKVALVAIMANPSYRSVAAMDAFDQENGLSRLSNWHYLTGDLSELQQLWAFYDVQTANSPAGSMTSHNDITYLIDAHGRARVVFASTPGNSAILHASYAAFLANEVEGLA